MTTVAKGEGGFSSERIASAAGLHVPAYMVWGANTDVGKTLVSAGLCRALVESDPEAGLLYLKPVQTGFPTDSDARLVANVAGLRNHLGRHAAAAAQVEYDPAALHAPSSGAWRAGYTSFAWGLAASPHLAVEREGRPVSAEEIVQDTLAHLGLFSAHSRRPGGALALVETAGGVASPAPCGRLQCDVMRPLRLPGLMVGDSRLGGISATVTSIESLLLRGYDTEVLVMLEGGLGNAAAIRSAVGQLPGSAARLAVVTLPAAPSPGEGGWEAVRDWCARPQVAEGFEQVLYLLRERHAQRVGELQAAAPASAEALWWPFTQHTMVPTEAITVIDSRCGDEFTVLRAADAEHPRGSLTPSFDAVASWWTQGTNAEQHAVLTKAMAYAAGRYGHVMFPENTHAAALSTAQLLLGGVGREWASRVFYSDNGSTAVEVGIKMAFRKFVVDNDLARLAGGAGDTPFPTLKVIGLDGCYHGDTLGAMDCQGPSVFTGDLQFPWYSGRGLWLEPALFAQRDGVWTVTLPGHLQAAEGLSAADLVLPSRDAAFDVARNASPLAEVYRRDIDEKMKAATAAAAEENVRFGALIIEPVVMGAGGMLLVDPLYQRVLVQRCKARRIPVIYDEVFAGIWRFGRETTIDFLHETPDVACYAKLLTGGMIPLAVTLATREVFEAFEGDSKLDALLHGHSYTAHAVGCQVATAALQLYKSPDANPNWRPSAACDCASVASCGGCPPASSAASLPRACGERSGVLREMWDPALVTALSRLSCVERVFSLGTVAVVEVKPEPGAASGYNSVARTKSVVRTMRAQGAYVRPLGNVLYLMATPTTAPAKCTQLLALLATELDQLT